MLITRMLKNDYTFNLTKFGVHNFNCETVLCKLVGLADFSSFSAPVLTVTPEKLVAPVRWYEARKEYWRTTPATDAQWQQLIGCSKVIHFFHCFTRICNVTGDPRVEMYSYLSPQYCPHSLYPVNSF